jgi:Domain of unknown function (DUF4248)
MHKYLRPLRKSELSKIFEISVKTFITWIEAYPALIDEISRFGEYKYQQFFNQRQVEAIFQYLGFPNDFSILNYEKRPIRTYKKNEVAKFYGISLSTLRRMIENAAEISFINESINKKYNLNEVSMIFEFLGHPLMIKMPEK